MPLDRPLPDVLGFVEAFFVEEHRLRCLRLAPDTDREAYARQSLAFRRDWMVAQLAPAYNQLAGVAVQSAAANAKRLAAQRERPPLWLEERAGAVFAPPLDGVRFEGNLFAVVGGSASSPVFSLAIMERHIVGQTPEGWRMIARESCDFTADAPVWHGPPSGRGAAKRSVLAEAGTVVGRWKLRSPDGEFDLEYYTSLVEM